MFWLFPLIFGSLILPGVFLEEDSKLLLVQALFRHGDRAPRNLYPKDPNGEENWPEGLGKLTRLGKQQQYALGKFLRSMYQDFITTNPNEVLVNSSAEERCLTGAAVTMASFYAPEGRWQFEEDLLWQPILVHSTPLEQDKYLSFRGTCPRVTMEIRKELTSNIINEFAQKHLDELVAISNYAGLLFFGGINALDLYDTLRIEKLHNLTIPEWAELNWDVLREGATAIFESFIRSPLVLRLRAGPLIQYIEENMRKKIQGDAPNLKVQVFSTHDATIAAVLRALDFTGMPRPPYCATLLFELHEISDASMAVRLLYLNSTDPLADMGKPQVLHLDGCSEFCPLENFTKKVQSMIPDNWEEECDFDVGEIIVIE